MKTLAVLFALTAVLAVGCGGGDDDEPASSSAVPFDQAFIDAMVPHHQEAIEMAEAAKARGLTVAELDQIADDIIATQQGEIDQMLAWREEWFGSRDIGPLLPEVLGLSEDELGMEHGSAAEITNAADADATFAAMMVPHHEGAIAMAEVARERAEHDEIEALAAAILAAQEREVATLEEHASAEHHG
jgi:uncharacterized protein (DUF305 family)